MRFLLCLLLFFVAVTPAMAKRVALVIGNQDYSKLEKLNNPVRDVHRLARVLKRHGFDVLACEGDMTPAKPGCTDLSGADMRDALTDLRSKAHGADLALVYFAGHGMQTAKGNVLAPTDMRFTCTIDKATGKAESKREVPLAEVIEALAPAKDRMVILDACRNTPPKAQACPAARGAIAVGFGPLPNKKQYYVLSSTARDELALDGPKGGHSPFAQALFHWLDSTARPEGPRLRFQSLFERVVNRVMTETDRAGFPQVPERFISALSPDHCLAGKGCFDDPARGRLEAENERLKEQLVGVQDQAAWAARVQRALAGDAKISPKERERQAQVLAKVGRDLNEFDRRGPAAKAALEKGDDSKAKALLLEMVAARKREREKARAREAVARQKEAEGYRSLAALARPKNVAEAAGYYRLAAELAPAHLETWFDLARTSKAAGNTGEALRAYREASKRAKAAGTPVDRMRAAAGQGDILVARGRLGRALAFYRAAEKIAEGLAAEDPEDLGAQRNLSVAYQKVGNVLVAQGNLSARPQELPGGSRHQRTSRQG